MSWLQFISSVIDALVWPVAVVLIAYGVKGPISALLPTLRNLKYKDLELDFGKELKKAEEQAKVVLPKRAAPKQLEQERPERNPEQIIKEAERLVEDFPEPSVALAWSAIEAELMSAIMRTASSPDYPPHNSAMKNALFLKDAGYLGEDKIDLLKRMNNLRNIAVHGHRGMGPVTVDDAREFLSLTSWLVEDLKSIQR